MTPQTLTFPVRAGHGLAVEDLARVVEADFLEMPGMRLTLPQISRLCNLSHDDCLRALDYLLTRDRLRCDDRDRFHR